jgi:iron complex transport system ATP-binding protein
MTLGARRLVTRLGDRRVIDGLDLDLATGEFVGLIGPNGAGKSTLLRTLAGILPHDGEITFCGTSLDAKSGRERALTVGYLAQNREIAWPIAVAELVALGRLPHRAPFAGETAADRAAVAEALRLTGLEPLAERRIDRLSGGELARVLLARVLAQETPVLLADEPAAGLDPAHQVSTMQIFSDLARAGRGVLVSLHDLTSAARWCDRLILVADGRVVAEGRPESVLTAERLAAVYGIEARIENDADGFSVTPLRLVGRPIEGVVS